VFVALVIQHAKRMHHIILPPVACLAVPLFPYYLINRTIIRNKLFIYKMYVLIFCTTFV